MTPLAWSIVAVGALAAWVIGSVGDTITKQLSRIADALARRRESGDDPVAKEIAALRIAIERLDWRHGREEHALDGDPMEKLFAIVRENEAKKASDDNPSTK